MLNPINITTESGIRLDVSPSATIEVNMGGISLLDLSSRTATYTNSFSMPRTPINESVFEFASQPTRNNRPIIDVIITKGFFQRTGILSVISFDKEYKATIKYTDAIEKLKSFIYEPYYNDIILTTTDNITTQLNTICSTGYSGLVYLRTSYSKIPSGNAPSRSMFVKLESILSLIATENNIIINGDLLTDSDFLKTYINVPYVRLSSTGNELITYQIQNVTFKKTAAELIKRICLCFMCDFNADNDTITLNKINRNANEMQLEGFSGVEKTISGTFKYTNFVSYKLAKNIVNTTGLIDIFYIGGGIGVDNIDILSYIPEVYTDGSYNTTDDDAVNEEYILFSEIQEGSKVITFQGTNYSVVTKLAAPLSIAGYYSDILNPIFANPVILEANKYLDPLTADNIMTTRVVNSVQLGGRYWVDQFAYNLTTGQSKLTLIKLP